jgi:two-component system, OmpR family, response regulator
MRILLVSPSRTDSSYLHKALRESAHSLQVTDDLRDGLFLASQEAFDVILVVAGERGQADALHTLLPDFSALPSSPAMILLMGTAAPAERARMLRAGADACFVQPYSFIEIQERMAALCRGVSQRPREPASDTSVRLDALTHELVEGDRRLAVTKREYLVIECLLRQSNGPVARDQLIRYAWAEADDVDASNVNVVISRLRRKLQHHGFDAHIETVSHFGYKLGTR